MPLAWPPGSLSTAYALGDVLGLKHSLHRGIKHAKGFYLMYATLIAGAATIVLIPGSPLGLFTEGVQVLAGVLLPSATVFLLLLCNDKAVLGPWVNGRATNAFSGAVIALLIMLSLILVSSVVFPGIGARQIIIVMAGSAVLAGVTGVTLLIIRRNARSPVAAVAAAGGANADATRVLRAPEPVSKQDWRIPALAMLAPAPMSTARRVGMTGMWVYLAIAMSAVVLRIIEVATGH